MPLQSIQAVAHPAGNRIDLAWWPDATLPADGVRVVRREGRYPQHPQDGVIVADVTTATAVSDLNLPAERVYYYSLFPFTGGPPVYEYDPGNRAMALATAPNGYAQTMLGLLPAIYHRYDKDTRFLARFLRIGGGQLDQFHSLANFSRRLRQLDKTPGPLLPLLAQWIAWQTDYKRDLNTQRDEIRNAPAIYRRIGLAPTLEATIKRINNWESRSKEYVHNIFASNQPPRLNLWSLRRDSGGAWSATETLQSLDYCYEGRASHVVDSNGVRRLFYHTQRKGRWEIWSKTTPWAALSPDMLGELAAGPITAALWQALTDAGLSLAQTSMLSVIGSRVWEIADGARRFTIEREAAQLTVYDRNEDAMAFGHSRPEVAGPELAARINKYPSVAPQGDVLWLFWTVCDEATGRWRVELRRRQNAQWSEVGPAAADGAAINPFIEAGDYAAARPRRRAFAAADGDGGVWLFWQEYGNGRWRLRYNYHDGVAWGEAISLPLDGGADPRVQDDIMAVVTPGATERIYLFWARPAAVVSADGERWQVAVRMKNDQALDAANWSAVKTLPKAAADNHHDREPFALLNAGGQPEVFWASNREDSGWSVWRSTLLNFETGNWSPAERITEPVSQQRAPLPVALGAGSGLGLFYRGNRKRVYNSEIYRATEMHDERYGGSFAADTRHYRLIELRDRFEDPQRYTYDTGRNGVRDDGDRIARDTIGAFIGTDTLTDQEVANGVARLRPIVQEFMPMTDRAVFITDRTVHAEYVYDYTRPATAAPRYIDSSYLDEWVGTAEESALADGEDFSAELES
jgi:phage tail-like protein